MEDAHTMQLHIDDDKEAAFFAVFDGHGGKLTSQGHSTLSMMAMTGLSVKLGVFSSEVTWVILIF